MSANLPTADETETVTETEFEAALDAATRRARYEFEPAAETEVLFPETNYKAESVTGSLVWAASPSTTVAYTALNEPDADEVDGATPGDDAPRSPRAVLFAAATDDEAGEVDLAFSVAATFTNSYDDERVVVETPAPWDTPDDMTGANEIIKSLPWDDDEAEDHPDLDAGVHYTFDDDDREAPPEASEAWALDKHGAAALKAEAEAAGYEWHAGVFESAEGDDGETDADALDRLAAFAEQDDRVRARYRKKNGNGVGAYEGEVHSAAVEGAEDERGYEVRTTGVVFEDENDRSKRLKRDDDGVPAMFSNGHYPFMGELLSVEVVPHESRGLDAE